MKLTAQVKLLPSDVQRDALLATMERINAACDKASGLAWKARTFGQFNLHKLVYRGLRDAFGLASQVAVRAIAKVADAYKLDHDSRREFRHRGAICYDSRILSWKGDSVSIWTLSGREVIPFVCGDRQRAQLQGARGETDLVYRGGQFYLLVSVDAVEQPKAAPTAWLGVDLGIANIAVDSDGAVYSGAKIDEVRTKIGALRAALQSKGTKSAKRHLKRLRRKERDFHAHTNHVISKAIAQKAKDTGRGVALEDLTGIRERVTVRHAQRARHHSWSFAQLRAFVSYKVALLGVALGLVDPRNTSRTCPRCGCIDKANRRSQSEFRCVQCGFEGNADHVGSINIAARATVNWPIVATLNQGIGKLPGPLVRQLQSLGL